MEIEDVLDDAGNKTVIDEVTWIVASTEVPVIPALDDVKFARDGGGEKEEYGKVSVRTTEDSVGIVEPVTVDGFVRDPVAVGASKEVEPESG